MPRKYEMSWEPGHRRWVKMVNGKRFKVACSTLAERYGNLPEQDWTKEASYPLANRWLAEELGEARPLVERIADEAGGLPSLVDTLVRGQAAAEFLHHYVNGEPDATTATVMQAIGKAVNPSVPRSATVSAAIDDFLELLRNKGTKPRTYKELEDVLGIVRGWWGAMDVAQIDESKVEDAYKRIAGMPIQQNTKNKRWGFFKRFVKRLFETGKINLPRNLASRFLSFKQQVKAVKTFPLETVRSQLTSLPERLRLWAMLGLNCGMTNTDISGLTKDMVKGEYLTRRRVKTADNANCPTVSYKLWPETLTLLNQFKSDHATLWLTTVHGTALVGTRMEEGKFTMNDGISRTWQRYGDCPITPAKFRNVAANLLEGHEVYGRYKDHFLAHVPASVTDRFYAAPSQELFDKALDWLRLKVI